MPCPQPSVAILARFRNLEVAYAFARHISEVHVDALIDELDSELSRFTRSEASLPLGDAPCEADGSTMPELDTMDWYADDSLAVGFDSGCAARMGDSNDPDINADCSDRGPGADG